MSFSISPDLFPPWTVVFAFSENKQRSKILKFKLMRSSSLAKCKSADDWTEHMFWRTRFEVVLLVRCPTGDFIPDFDLSMSGMIHWLSEFHYRSELTCSNALRKRFFPVYCRPFTIQQYTLEEELSPRNSMGTISLKKERSALLKFIQTILFTEVRSIQRYCRVHSIQQSICQWFCTVCWDNQQKRTG